MQNVISHQTVAIAKVIQRFLRLNKSLGLGQQRSNKRTWYQPAIRIYPLASDINDKNLFEIKNGNGFI